MFVRNILSYFINLLCTNSNLSWLDIFIRFLLLYPCDFKIFIFSLYTHICGVYKFQIISRIIYVIKKSFTVYCIEDKRIFELQQYSFLNQYCVILCTIYILKACSLMSDITINFIKSVCNYIKKSLFQDYVTSVVTDCCHVPLDML